MPERTADTLVADELAACLTAVAAHQDRKAFRTLFDHFAPRVRAYGLRLGCTPPQAEELAQETMVKVWRKAGLFDPAKAAPSTWIFRIARNQRIDAFRRESHPEFDPNDPALIPDEEIPADQMIEQRQSGEALRLQLETLPEEQKLLLHMSFYQDMPHSLIAEKLNLPLGTVKSRLRLAMGKLKSRLADQHATPTVESDT
tara:strand:+ start:6623 stop:7222 length:600 start_codon:yes stop_codon:yes gene_type:complete